MQTAASESGAEPLTDTEVAQRVAADDWQVLHDLMRRHNQLLYRTARSILRNDADAEDAVQEAYLHAYHAMGSFRGEAKLSTWLVRIVVNEAIGRVRKRDRTARIIRMDGGIEDEGGGEDTRECAPDSPERDAMRSEARTLLERNIDMLPDAFRAVFVLRGVEEMTVEETAAALDIPEATVRTRYFRARGLLRESLARDLDVAIEDAFSFAGERCDRIVAGVLKRLASGPQLERLLERNPASPS
jgi:RNA polymerase sigma-70 factor (ECF subfamily)